MSEKICRIEGCSNAVYRKEYCGAHYSRYKRYGDPLAGGKMRRPRYNGASCKAPWCNERAYSQELCPRHYWRYCALLKRRGEKDVVSLKGEVWKDIPGYNGQYQVSNLGRVKSLPRWRFYSNKQLHHYPGKLLSAGKGSTGYLSVRLGDKGREAGVHRFVAEAFLPKIPGKNDVNHKDGDKSNNKIENLEWVSRKENMEHCRDVLKKETGRKKIPVRCVETGEIFESLSRAALAKQVSVSQLCSVIKGEERKAGGYHWVKVAKFKPLK